jgi:hypothetical protein
MEGEPAIWHRRFSMHYLLVPAEKRSVDAAYAQARGEQHGSAPVAKASRRAPGSWHNAAVQWRWRQRASAWDSHEIRSARTARIRAVKKTQEKHAMIAAFLISRVIGRLQEIGFGQVSDAIKLASTARDLIGLERLIYEAPIDAEAIRQVERDHEEKPVDQTGTWEVTPEDLIAVAAGWAQLGIAIHDESPGSANGPCAALSPPVADPAGHTEAT